MNNALQYSTSALRSEARRLKVCILAGVVSSGDAVSEAIMASVDAISALQHKASLDIRVFCLSATIADPRVYVLTKWQDILKEDHFRTADIIIHHFSIFSEIHYAASFARRDAFLAVVYYGITPPQFLPKENWALAYESYKQLGSFSQANQFFVTSRFLLGDLGRAGLHRRARLLELFSVNVNERREISEKQLNILDVVFCGRFSPSKCIVELLQAFVDIAPQLGAVRLTLIGIREFSDEKYLKRVNSLAEHLPKNIKTFFKFDLRSDEVGEAISNSDLLVLPSLHEGFGMPVVEALQIGTPVLCSDAGSLPEVTSGFALTYPHGDFSALCSSLYRALSARRKGRVLCDRGEWDKDDWVTRAQDEARRYSRKAFKNRWLEAFQEIMIEAETTHSDISKAHERAFEALTPSVPKSSTRNIDAQLLGRLYGLRLGEISVSRLRDAIQLLHVWFFAREADEQELNQWEGVAEGKLSRVIMVLIKSDEIRRYPEKLGLGAGLIQGARESENNYSSKVKTDLAEQQRPSFGITDYLLKIESHDQFIQELYLSILCRVPEPGEILPWRLAIEDGSLSRDKIIKSFINSSEYRNKNGFVDPGDSGGSLDGILKEIDFLLKVPDTGGEFIRLVYQKLLQRDPGETELNEWHLAMSSGISKNTILESFVNSNEFSSSWPHVNLEFIQFALKP